MSDDARRVVLLARPGAARDRMREALDQAGANIVLEADPASTDQAAVLASQPQVALIVLDASTDEALDRFEGVLSNPSIEVLFEEAEHAVGRVGWDAARWVRHLRAKLGHADSVLPPGRAGAEPSAPLAEPARAPAAAAAAVAMPPELPAAMPPELPPITPPELPAAMPPPLPPITAEVPASTEQAKPFSFADMELVAIELDDTASDYVHEHGADALPPFAAAKFELDLPDEVPAATATDIRIEGLELDDNHPADASRFHSDLADLNSRMASMELVEDRTVAPAHGAVLVLAGIGGPDAVRQLLGALPDKFPRAVLVQQRLDGGHYDKLVAQMQRATALPVKLAASGDAVQAATVYILPPTLGVQAGERGLVFNEAAAELLTSLPANDSAVLMLSGADPVQVDVVMKLAGSGTFVAGQALDGCYDVAAPAALAARGGQSGKPQELARRLAERWH
jgi:chemosensory pili system protein ChpB (putative protein-glutamate methylesterase)